MDKNLWGGGGGGGALNRVKRVFFKTVFSKYPKNELVTQTFGVTNIGDKLTCPSITFK